MARAVEGASRRTPALRPRRYWCRRQRCPSARRRPAPRGADARVARRADAAAPRRPASPPPPNPTHHAARAAPQRPQRAGLRARARGAALGRSWRPRPRRLRGTGSRPRPARTTGRPRLACAAATDDEVRSCSNHVRGQNAPSRSGRGASSRARVGVDADDGAARPAWPRDTGGEACGDAAALHGCGASRTRASNRISRLVPADERSDVAALRPSNGSGGAARSGKGRRSGRHRPPVAHAGGSSTTFAPPHGRISTRAPEK